MIDLHVDTLFQTFFGQKPLSKTQLGEKPPIEGALLSLVLPGGLQPYPLPPPDAADELLIAARALQAQLTIKTWLSFEGPPPSVEALLQAGVLIIGLAHFWHSDYADSATDPRTGIGGLTPRGKAAALQIYQAGALVDVSHLSEASFYDTAKLASLCGVPLLATHSGAQGLVDNRRNLSDEQLRVIARSGGLIGVPVHAPFLKKKGEATTKDWAAQVMYIIGVVGLEAVAYGSDLDGNIKTPSDLPDEASVGQLAKALGEVGLSDEAIAAVLGGNARRLLSASPRQGVVCK